MAVLSFYTRYLLRMACKYGGAEVLEDLMAGLFESDKQGGMQMISGTTAGQSFSFGFDAKMTRSDLAVEAEKALTTFEQLGSVDAVLAFLRQPPVTRARVHFGGC